MQTVIAAEERYHLNFNRYTSVPGAGGLGLSPESQPGGYYVLAKLDVASDHQTVVATADPQNSQEADGCGSLTLDSSGRRGASGGTAADCW